MALIAQNSLIFPGLQLGVPTTRMEVVRWFGTIVLDLLYAANMQTSGTGNNMGFGIEQFPDNVWFCDNTLRSTSAYVSIKLADLFGILLFVGVVTIVSYALPQCLYTFIGAVGDQDKWWRWIGAPLISFTLHDVMHLYRIALKKTTGQDLNHTLSSMPVYGESGRRANGGKAPYYGIEAWDYYELLQGYKPQDVPLANLDPNQTATLHESENLEENNEVADDTGTITTINEAAFDAVRTSESESSVDVDDEIEIVSGQRSYVATMQADPGREGVFLDDVQ